MLDWLLGRPSVDPGEREAALAYLRQELRLAIVQSRGAEAYNAVVAAHGGDALTIATVAAKGQGIARLVAAAHDMARCYRDVATHHSGIAAPDVAVECFGAHELLYISYRRWGETIEAATRSLEAGLEPVLHSVAHAQSQLVEDRRRAEREREKLVRRIRLTSSQFHDMYTKAVQSVTDQAGQT